MAGHLSSVHLQWASCELHCVWCNSRGAYLQVKEQLACAICCCLRPFQLQLPIHGKVLSQALSAA